jgi:HSP20 family protein
MPTAKEPRTTNTGSSNGYVLPNVNILENKDGYVLQAEMPGVNKDGLDLTLEGNELTIEGRRGEEFVKAELLYRESRPLNYRRTFELDPAIDTGRIDARMEQGVLTLRLPKQEQVKPRKIAVGE